MNKPGRPMGGELLPPGGHKSWEGASVVVSGERKETIKGSPEYHRPIIDQTSFCCECWPLPGTRGNHSRPDLCDTRHRVEKSKKYSLHSNIYSHLSGATMAFQRADLQFFFLVGSSDEILQWRGSGGGEEQDDRAPLHNQDGHTGLRKCIFLFGFSTKHVTTNCSQVPLPTSH